MKTQLAYCSCGHSITHHILFEDPLPDDGTAPAQCKRCKCELFDCDDYLSNIRDQDARERARAWSKE
jgi:hypothetical protein